MDSATTISLQYGPLITGLGGGLALFLYGMRKMTESLKLVAGDGMKNIMARLTTNRFSAAAAGALVTAIIQSSSVTTVMVVSFVSAGIMTFTQSIGVIMGANIGTTITAQIIAFKITKYALVMIAVGFLMEILAKSRRTRYYGVMLMGLGLLFFGMELMSNAALPLRTYPPFIELMQEMRNPLMGMLVGMVFTALVQSSSATTGIVIVLATQGFISLEAGIALVLGANVGTCVTAMLSAIGTPRDAVKAAVVHVIFNLVGVLLLAAFIPQFSELVRMVSPTAPALSGTERMAAEVPRQVANAHTLFNVANMLVFIGFVGTLAVLVERIVPRPAAAPADKGEPVYLQDIFLDQPTLALDQVKLELERMGGLVLEATRRALPVTLTGDEKALETLRESDEAIDRLHGEILRYLGELSLRGLVEPQPRRIEEYIGIVNYLENLGDVVESEFVSRGYKRLQHDKELDQELHTLLDHLSQSATQALVQSLSAFAADDPAKAEEVRISKDEFNRMAEAARLRMARHLAAGGREALANYRLAVELVESLKRIHTLARRLARIVFDTWEEGSSSRQAEVVAGAEEATITPANASRDQMDDLKPH